MYKTPIYIDFGHTLSPQQEREIPSTITQPVLGSYNYYLTIKSPDTFNEISSLPLGTTRVNVPASGPLTNKVRLSLLPSIGYGVSSSYFVEYFRWQPTLVPAGTERRKIIPEKVREEHWYVPFVSGEFIPNYYEYLKKRELTTNFNYTRRLSKVTLTRGSTSADSLTAHPEVIDITRISQDSTVLTDWRLVDTSLYTNGSASIQWGSNGPSLNSEYEVEYVRPFSHQDLVFISYEDKGVLPGNFNVWNYPHRIY